MQGEIEFGVINQSQSAFSHILSDVSLVVYQFEALAGYSAVVDRLGQFQEAVEARGKVVPDGDAADYVMDPTSEITSVDTPATPGAPLQLRERRHRHSRWRGYEAHRYHHHDTPSFECPLQVVHAVVAVSTHALQSTRDRPWLRIQG